MEYFNQGGAKAIEVVAYVEIEAFIIANLVAQMESGILDSAPIWTNVKTFDARPFRNKIHGIIGGYPCQPFSNAGGRKGIEDERHLYPYISKQIEIIRPDWVYFENVAGHITMGYNEVRRDLSNLGYRVEEGIFTAEEVGAPHRRERIFILGVMENAGIIRWRRGDFRDTKRCECENKITGSGTALGQSGQLAYPHCNDTRAGFGNIQCEETATIGKEDKRQRLRGEFGPCDSTFSDTGSQRLEGCQLGGKTIERSGRTQPHGSVAECGFQGFPAGQGYCQFEWEEPRTIKSRMEYSINGYNFTEDLHRAIGNSVVEQTAELAFLNLLDKHIRNGS